MAKFNTVHPFTFNKETAKHDKAGSQSKFQNWNTKFKQNVDVRQMDRQKDNINL